MPRLLVHQTQRAHGAARQRCEDGLSCARLYHANRSPDKRYSEVHSPNVSLLIPEPGANRIAFVPADVTLCHVAHV